MLWLVWVIAIPVVLLVAGVVIRERVRYGSWPDELGLVFGSLLFASSLLGYFVTSFASPTLATWWQAPLVRVLWQTSGALVLTWVVLLSAAGAGRSQMRRVRLLAAGLLAVGPAMSYNAILDLCEGPLVLRGVSDVNIERTHGRGAKIWANFKGRATDGSTHQIDLTGWSANDGLDRLAQCEGAHEVDVTVLAHLDRVLDARCK